MVLIFDGTQEPKDFAGAADIGVRFPVDDFLDRRRVVSPIIESGIMLSRLKITLAA